jgi:hypothetical protein
MIKPLAEGLLLLNKVNRQVCLKNRVQYPMSPNGAASRIIFVIGETNTSGAKPSVDKEIPRRRKIRSAGALTVMASMGVTISCRSLLVTTGNHPRTVSANPTLAPIIKPFAEALMFSNVEAHWPGAAASGVAIGTKLNRLLPVQCSAKLGHYSRRACA